MIKEDRIRIHKRDLNYVVMRAAGMLPQTARKGAKISQKRRERIEPPEGLPTPEKRTEIQQVLVDLQELYAREIRVRIPPEKLADLVAQGCEAEMPDSPAPDWRARRFYMQMAAEHGRYVAGPAVNRTDVPQLVVNFVNVASDRQPVLQAPRTIDAADDSQ